MRRQQILAMKLIIILTSTISVLFRIQTVEASGTVYIRADGSVDPSTAPISSVDNVTYTFTDNINDSIVIERDNIVVDGAGYTLQGSSSGRGIDLSNRNNVTIKNMEVRGFQLGIYLWGSYDINISRNSITANNWDGIYLSGSSNNTLAGNSITTNNWDGIYLIDSSNNTLAGNNIANNWGGILLSGSSNISIIGNNVTANDRYGFELFYSSSNIISGNNVAANEHHGILLWHSLDNIISGNSVTANDECGIRLNDSSYNTLARNNVANNRFGISLFRSSCNTLVRNNVTANDECGIWLYGIWYYALRNHICHNNFVNNTSQVYSWGITVWDDGYPSGGNYWSDYTGIDEKSGPGQDLPGSDVIGDTPYIIDEKNTDRYPLMIAVDTNPPIIIYFFSSYYAEPDDRVRISANVTDLESSVREVILSYTTDGTTWENLTMNYNSTTTLYEATIREYPYETRVKYKIIAYDNRGNSATKDNAGKYYIYEVIPEFPSFLVLSLFMIATLSALIVYRRKHSV